MTSPFSKNYRSQLDNSDLSVAHRKREAHKAGLEKRRAAGDPTASGTIKGLSHKADRAIGLWPKGKPLNQPPINPQAKLQSDPPGKTAKLSRGRAI